jgi:hypothetical protein
MKILGLSCSPRKSGNTAILLEEALSGAQQEGAETELFSVSGKDIRPCPSMANIWVSPTLVTSLLTSSGRDSYIVPVWIRLYRHCQGHEGHLS